MDVNIELWYYISLFCDRDTIPTIVKICKSLHNGFKIATKDPICLTKISFNVICNGETLGQLVATNDSDYAIIKKIINIRDLLPSCDSSLDVVYSGFIKTYNYKRIYVPAYHTIYMKLMKARLKIQITTADGICYIAVIAEDEPVKIGAINNDFICKKFKKLFYYQMYYDGKLHGEHYDCKRDAASKICKRIQKLSKEVVPRSFSIVRKIDNKHFYYDISEDGTFFYKRKIECHLVLK